MAICGDLNTELSKTLKLAKLPLWNLFNFLKSKHITKKGSLARVTGELFSWINIKIIILIFQKPEDSLKLLIYAVISPKFVELLQISA